MVGSSFKMFTRSFAAKGRVGKLTKPMKKSFRDDVKERLLEKVDGPGSAGNSPTLTSPIFTIVVGPDQRRFAAHQDVLSHSPFFAMACQDQFTESDRCIQLPDEEPEVFSCVLEYLYKGDYYPRLVHDKSSRTWMLEGAPEAASPNLNTGGRGGGQIQATIFHPGVGDLILRDTAVYCAADRYGLEELKRLSLRKQGLQSGIEVSVILRTARYAYENTPDSDSRLRAHYLALIIRSRNVFKHSSTMQMEMEMGGKLFFDLFVAMAQHIDEISAARGSPRVAK